MAYSHHYRRVLVMVREGHAEPPAFHLAAELAHLLELELEGLFVEDEALFSLSALPFARELRLPGHTWQTLDPAEMREHFRDSANQARRLLTDAAARLGVPSSFAVLRGDPHSAPAERAGAEDILVLVEPGAIRAAAIGPRGRDIFRAGRSAVLLVPARAAERRGRIALLLPAARADVVAFGAQIARASAADLVLIVEEGAAAAEARAEAALRKLGLPPARLHRRHLPGRDPGLIARALRAAGARLVVLDRAGLGEDVQGFLARLLAESGTAVLLLGEPPAPAAAA